MVIVIWSLVIIFISPLLRGTADRLIITYIRTVYAYVAGYQEKEGTDMNRAAEPKGWNPYLAGALTGLLLVLSVWVAGKYFGASTTFVKSAGMLESTFSQDRVTQMEYFIKELPKIDWQWMFVVGIFFGSLIASLTSRSFRWQGVPTMWEGRFGPNRTIRAVVAFLGGTVAMFGARLADG